MKNYTQMSNKFKQAGFTLIELLIGLSLSLVIIGIALAYLVSSGASFRVNANDGYIQENSRFAFSYMTDFIRRAGSNSQAELGTNTPLIVIDAVCQDESGAAGGNTNQCTTANTGPNNSDKVAIAYVLSEGTSCNGQDIASFYTPNNGEQIIDELWVAADDDGINNLFCRTSLRDSTGAMVPQGASVPIIAGIDMMKVNYGVDIGTDAEEDFVTDRYINVDDVIAGNYQDKIRSVRLGILVNSGLTIGQDSNTEILEDKTYTVFGADSDSLNDQVLRQIFSTTIHLPNARER